MSPPPATTQPTLAGPIRGSVGRPAQSPWERLRRGADIRSVLQTGKRRGRGRVVLYVLPGRVTRVAFVCGRRVGGAVVRNRARRLMREAWRDLAPGIQGGFDIVVMARPEIVGAHLSQVLVDLHAALTGAGLIER